MLTIAIPSRNEKFLKNTIEDVLKNATGEIKIYPVLDGYDIPDEEFVDDPRVEYIKLPKQEYTQKRHAINMVVDKAKSKYVMSMDAHCMVAPGFDEQLIKDHRDNWVSVPRRNRLDAENWCLQKQSDNRPPIDYEYFMWSGLTDKNKPGLHGFKWDARTNSRADVDVDYNMTMQASMWMMTKERFNKLGLMNIDRYSGWGQEAEEIVLENAKAGGHLITNKNTWYAHLHKGKKWGRMYFMSRSSVQECNEASFKYWVKDNKDFFIHYLDRFDNKPKYPDNWKDILWKL